MQDEKHGRNFWLGNAILAVALLMVLFMGALWETLGVTAMVLWVVVTGIGAFLIASDKAKPPRDPD